MKLLEQQIIKYSIANKQLPNNKNFSFSVIKINDPIVMSYHTGVIQQAEYHP